MSGAYERRTGSQLLNIGSIVDLLRRNWLLWLVPTLAFMTVGTLYALTRGKQWQASQALVVRDEVAGEMGFGNSGPLGRFESNDELKRSLETILQIAKNPGVAKAALKKVGPPEDRKSEGEFPTESEVEGLTGNISLSAPKGTEFGTSDYIYLTVKSNTQDRAVSLAVAVCDAMEKRMTQLRTAHSKSLVAELKEKQRLANHVLMESTAKLSAFERKLGSDLAEMRTLAESSGGDGALRVQVNQIRGELRNAERQRRVQAQLFHLLRKVGGDPNVILSAPSRLLEVQPSLRQLKDGLVAAKLATAKLRSSLTDTHPQVLASEQTEKNVLRALVREARNSIRAAAEDVKAANTQVKSLEKKLASVKDRLGGLAGQRAEYVNVSAEVDQRREQYKQINDSLSEARGRLEASDATSLITRFESPTTGSRPLGPGKSILILGTTLGGLFLGLTLVYLLAPWQGSNRSGRRASDMFRRRSSDKGNPYDRRALAAPAVPQLTDARPLEYQSLPDAVKALPSASDDPSVKQALAQMSQKE